MALVMRYAVADDDVDDPSVYCHFSMLLVKNKIEWFPITRQLSIIREEIGLNQHSKPWPQRQRHQSNPLSQKSRSFFKNFEAQQKNVDENFWWREKFFKFKVKNLSQNRRLSDTLIRFLAALRPILSSCVAEDKLLDLVCRLSMAS